MGKFLLVVAAVIIYGSFCYSTMPSQCFTFRHVGECQRIQLATMIGQVHWETVNSIREFN